MSRKIREIWNVSHGIVADDTFGTTVTTST